MAETRVERVLMTADTVGGVWTFATDLARELRRRGTEVVLAALGGTPSAAQMRDAEGAVVVASDYKLEWMEEPWSDVEASRAWLLRLEREYSPDLIHLNSFGHGSLPFRAPVVLTVHSTVTSWWRAVHGEEAPESWDRYREAMRTALASAEVITAPTQAMAAEVGADCVVIPNGRDGSRFQKGPKEAFVFTAGRLWDQAKNTAAVARIAERLPWPVYAAGDPGDAHFEGCRMLGPLPVAEMRDWFARAAVYALPALYEPFGYSALEAALSGCALVLGDIPSLREVWGDTARFVPPHDGDALVRALSEAMDSPSDDRAYRRALEFTSERMAQGYLDVYQGCLCTS